MNGESDCPFCQIVVGAAPAELVCESTDWIAFFPDAPATPGHTLVVPRKHIPSFLELDESTGTSLMAGIVRVGRAIESALNPEGMNVISSFGEAAEQTVFHVHFHIVPRRAGDVIGRIWPPKRRTDEEVKNELAERIRDACQSGDSM